MFIFNFYSGYCMKKSNSYLPFFLPCIYKKWKRRYFILCGNYLFRYSDEFGEKPKGVPIPLGSCQIKALNSFDFEISTLRKQYVIRTDSETNRDTWLKAIRERKSQAVRETMGHAPVEDTIRMANKAGEKLFQERLKRDVDDRHMNQMIMNPMNALGSSSAPMASY